LVGATLLTGGFFFGRLLEKLLFVYNVTV